MDTIKIPVKRYEIIGNRVTGLTVSFSRNDKNTHVKFNRICGLNEEKRNKHEYILTTSHRRERIDRLLDLNYLKLCCPEIYSTGIELYYHTNWRG